MGVEAVPIESCDDLIDAICAADRRHIQIALATAATALAGNWAVDGASSFGAWLQHHCHLTRTAANTLLHEGRFLTRYPAVATAALASRLSAAQVTVIRRSVTPPLAELFDEHQHTVVDAVHHMNIIDTIIVCTDWRAKAEALLDIEPPDLHHDRSWTMAKLDNGTIVGRFVFDPTSADALNQALEIARTPGEHEPRSNAQSLADAVASIMSFFNANHERTITPRHRHHVEMVIDPHAVLHPDCDPTTCPGHDTGDPTVLFDLAFGAGRCTTMDGTLLPDWASDAYTCDCFVHRVVRSGSAVLDYGLAERTPPKDLYRAVAARDQGCRFPDCHRPISWCNAHHITHWTNLGPTALRNLLMLCSYHHHFIHRQRWKIVLHPNAHADFTTPLGVTITESPWVRWRLGLLVSNPGRGGLLGSVER
ncbi:MAG: putative endonuclease [Ilumatobacteraceae bacterium]|nr:putative endonuclease [Ilumatobacteraceae bacterium]